MTHDHQRNHVTDVITPVLYLLGLVPSIILYLSIGHYYILT